MKGTLLSSSNTSNLRCLLNGYAEELSLSFLERRGREASHRGTILEELEDVISILTRREKDLLSAVNISLRLLDENDTLHMKHKLNKEKYKKSISTIQHLSKDIEAYKESLLASETRYEHLNKTLIETEELMLTNSAELNRLLRERHYESSLKGTDDELDQLTKGFKSRIEHLEKIKWELEREKSSICQRLFNLEKELTQNKESCLKLEIKLDKLKKSFIDLEKEKDIYKEKSEQLQSEYQILNSHYFRIKMQCERLEEDLSLKFLKETETSKQLESNRFTCVTEVLSLEDELGEISDNASIHDDTFCEGFFGNSTTKLEKRKNLSHSYLKLLALQRSEDVSVFPKKSQRKSPPEEYFALSVQAVKMNSPYIERIINASGNELYEKALKMKIPFHNWHYWIENQLNAIYVQTIYNKNVNNLWKRYTQKMCLGSS